MGMAAFNDGDAAVGIADLRFVMMSSILLWTFGCE